MTTTSTQASLELFDALEIEYEHAYKHCPAKIAAVQKASSLIPPSSHVLDIGCGTGSPTTELLSAAGHKNTGIDISPKMINHCHRRFKGDFIVADMLTYKPEIKFAAVFIIFSQLMLSYAEFHAMTYKFANALQPGGILVIGQMPADKYVREEKEYDETGTYVEAYDAPFMGQPFPTLMLTVKGQRMFLESMGLEIVDERVEVFQPDSEKCEAEEQQYVIARRGGEVGMPWPMPRGE